MQVAVIGAGLIGRAWSIVFSRAGFNVALWDPVAAALPAAMDFIAARLPELHAAGLVKEIADKILPRIRLAASLEEAVANAEYVQENGPERLEAKIPLFQRLDAAVPSGKIIASSTSGIPASAFTEHLSGRARCLVAHPVNPPYLIPLVEIAPQTTIPGHGAAEALLKSVSEQYVRRIAEP